MRARSKEGWAPGGVFSGVPGKYPGRGYLRGLLVSDRLQLQRCKFCVSGFDFDSEYGGGAIGKGSES